ncbi:MAG: 50S ribosomal protein L9 [Acidobacteria bacterium]|nr:50S ribosomal protein L9 [Acidobacteriota bacterium]
MKIILIEDVENLGRRGNVVKVADGYARNYLIPQRFAMQATPGNLKYVENQKLVWVKQEAKLKEEAEILAQALGEVRVHIEKKVGEGDNLYGSVTTMDIAHQLEEKGFQIDRRKIRLDHPIKTLGEYTIPIRLHRDVTAEIKVLVAKEGGETALAAEVSAPVGAPGAENRAEESVPAELSPPLSPPEEPEAGGDAEEEKS